MSLIRVPGLRPKPRKGYLAWYWEPWPAAAALGFKTRALRRPDGGWMDEGEAIAAARVINDELERARAGEGERLPARGLASPRSFAALIKRYKVSDGFLALAPATQRGYGKELDVIERAFGDIAVPVFGMDDARTWLKTFKTPSRKRGVGAVLRLLLSFAAFEAKWIAANPLLGKGRSGLNLPTPGVRVVVWSYKAEAAFVRAALASGESGLALAVLAGATTGQRVTDLLQISERMRDAQGRLVIDQQKSDGAEDKAMTITLPFLLPRFDRALKDELARRRRGRLARLDAHWILNPHTGSAYDHDQLSTFDHAFGRVRALAVKGSNALELAPCPELAGLQFRDLRDTFVTRAADAGCDPIAVCAVTGHIPANMTNAPGVWRHYLLRTPMQAKRCLEQLMAFEATLGIEKLFEVQA